MSILTRVLKVFLKATVKVLVKDAAKGHRKVEKLQVNKKVKQIDKKFVAERARLRTKAEQYQKRAIQTHAEAEAAKKVLREKANALHNEAVQSRQLADKLEGLLK
ncbi:hypothetical protein [Vibrio phage JSF30]|uniref:Uncharacterized protein n=1 Tax=Vibrio phage JSF30 TaxID=1983607 RepID=A0A2D0Z4P3_9CAUD|nr:hypothetical protein [Vibrio phage JSF30]